MVRVFAVVQSGVVRAGLHSILQTNFEIVDVPEMADVILTDSDVQNFYANFSAAILLFSDDAVLRQEFLQQEFLQQGAEDKTHRAFGIVSANATQQQICAAVAALANGLLVLPQNFLSTPKNLGTENIGPENTGRMAVHLGADNSDDSTETLTARELDVLALLAEGDGNKRIALTLGISQSTVKFHLAQIYQKLDVTTRSGAVQVALRRGLITL